MKLLTDECLSPELAKLAQSRGHGNSSRVVWLKMGGWKDWNLKRFVLDGDWTFVTKNAVDFRGSSSRRGSKGQYSDVALHAGLICLSGPEGMDLDLQLELFELALDEVGDGDLINQVLEITIDEQTEIRVFRYALPPD
jgi:predicted nuclease of predicted toxin-antitoxin system